MSTRIVLFLLPFFLLNELNGIEKAIPLSFDELTKGYREWMETGNMSYLSSLDQQQVKIRGFLYSVQEGKWVLAAEPNLKSCCIGSSNKIAQQLIVSGEFPKVSGYSATYVQGEFHFNSKADTSGKFIELFTLTNSFLIEEQSFIAFYLMLTAAVLVAFYLIRMRY